MSRLRANQQNKYRALWEFSRGVNDVRSTPANMQIAKSNTCNFKCVYCVDHRAGNDIPRTKLDGDTWDRLLHLVPQTETLAFHGISEFMIDPDFFKIIDLCANAHVALSINTNGSVCTPKYVDALANYPCYLSINFSLDAATPETFLRIRGWDFNRVLRNIRTYVEHFQARRRMTWITLSFVITKSSAEDMLPFVYIAKELNVDAVQYYRLHEYDNLDWEVGAKHGPKFNYKDECVNAFAHEYDAKLELTRQLGEMLGVRIELPAPLGQ